MLETLVGWDLTIFSAVNAVLLRPLPFPGRDRLMVIGEDNRETGVMFDDTTPANTLWTQAGSFTDADSSSWTATVNYGDGGGVGPLVLTGTTFNLSHTYTVPGIYTVTVVVTDDGDIDGTDTVQVTVTEAPTAGIYFPAIGVTGTDVDAPVVTLT